MRPQDVLTDALVLWLRYATARDVANYVAAHRDALAAGRDLPLAAGWTAAATRDVVRELACKQPCARRRRGTRPLQSLRRVAAPPRLPRG